MVAPASDQVSGAVTAVLTAYGREYQAISAQLSEFHEEFARGLAAGAGAYAAAEAANASPLQTLEQDVLGVINAPTNPLLGRPLIGPGTNGAPGPGLMAGQAGFCGAMAVAAGRVQPARVAGAECRTVR